MNIIVSTISWKGSREKRCNHDCKPNIPASGNYSKISTYGKKWASKPNLINSRFKNAIVIFFSLSMMITLPSGIPPFQTSEAFDPSIVDDNTDKTGTKNNIDNGNSDFIIESESTTSVSAAASGKVYGDFNGDGFEDLAIGVPGESVGSVAGAGGVEVIYGSSNGLSATSPKADQFWTQDSTNIEDVAETGDLFGSSLASADFNGDGRDDLAIGVGVEDVGSIFDAGAVEVIYGSSGGLSATSVADQFWTQDSLDINDHSDTNDLFGSTLTTGDFNGDGRDDLAIGTPGESFGTVDGAGGVEVIYGSSSGLSAISPRADQFWTQDSANIEDLAELGDSFGFNSLASGDFNGDGKDDLAIGISNEGVGTETFRWGCRGNIWFF
jgi:hypothetical protein